jgi:hypothetical protein
MISYTILQSEFCRYQAAAKAGCELEDDPLRNGSAPIHQIEPEFNHESHRMFTLARQCFPDAFAWGKL